MTTNAVAAAAGSSVAALASNPAAAELGMGVDAMASSHSSCSSPPSVAAHLPGGDGSH